MQDIQQSHEAVLRTLLVCDLVDSTRLVQDLGDARAAELFASHDHAARALLKRHHGREIDKTDGFLLLFERPINAVLFALAYHDALKALSRERGVRVQSRVGIHLGEVVLRENPPQQVALGAKPLEVEGLAKPTAARVMALAMGRQTLLTRGAFDLARRAAVGTDDHSSNLRWLAHGSYLIKGVEDPLEVFEVGAEGAAPLTAPAGSEKAQRVVGDGTIAGWRPAPGMEVPQRSNWQVTRKLGEGGFGEVWLAAHQKTRDQRVFKFCYDKQSLRTLKRETTLFRLLKEELGDRDDIARILDWNFEQAPYFMESEYTEGGSFIDWAEEQGGLDQVPLTQRLEIIAQVADALAAAHSVGVLHKDVKPGNVLIATEKGGEPQAMLMDFGIGRITDEERLAAVGITRLGLTEMAPHSDHYETGGTRLYMAPELVEGKASTVQGDIYALGVMLYQVVVGDFSRALAPGWRRNVEDELLCEDIARAVDGSAKRRLGNASRIAERLRSLDERRVNLEAKRRAEAEAEQAKIALQRAHRRRKVLLGAMAILIVFAVTMAIQAQRIAREAERANREAQAAEQVAAFLVDLFEVSDPGEARGNTIRAREILDRGAQKITTELADQPRVQARLMDTMGTVYQRLGLYDAAVPLLEDALRKRRDLFGEIHLDVAQSEEHLGEVLKLKAAYAEAEALYREALAERRELLGDQHPLVADSLAGLADVLSRQGDYVEAEPLLREALAMRRELLGNEHADVAQNLEDLGLNLFDQGDYEASEPLLRESVAMRRKLLGDDPHPDLAEALNNLAFMLHTKGDYTEVEELLREALDMKRILLGAAHPEIAMGLNNLAIVLHDNGDYAAAESMYQEVIAMQRQLLGEDHPDVAMALNNLAFLLYDKGDRHAAVVMSRESLAMYRRVLGDEHPAVARGLNNLGAWSMEQGDYATAEPMLREALAMRRKLLGGEHADVGSSMTNLARLLVATGRYEEARSLAAGARAILTEALSEKNWRTAVATSVEGASLTGLADFEQAETLLLESYSILSGDVGTRAVHITYALQRLVDLYEAWGRPDEAGKYLPLLRQSKADRTE